MVSVLIVSCARTYPATTTAFSEITPKTPSRLVETTLETVTAVEVDSVLSTPMKTSQPPIKAREGRKFIAFDVTQDSHTKVALMPVECIPHPRTCAESIAFFPEFYQIDMAGPLTWEPGGQKVALVSNIDGNQDITVISVDGSEARDITKSPEREDCPAWSPNGGSLLFTKEVERSGVYVSEIWRIHPDGKDPEYLVDGICGNWDITGQKIVYTMSAMDITIAGNVYTIDLSLEGSVPVKIPTPLEFVYQAFFSPDGTKIAFSGTANDRSTIYVVNADGSDLFELTRTLPDANNPVWSPDGLHVAFTAHHSRMEPGEIFVVDVNGSNLVNVSNSPLGRQ